MHTLAGPSAFPHASRGVNVKNSMSAAQAAQQGNRDVGGRYAESSLADPGSDVDLAGTAASCCTRCGAVIEEDDPTWGGLCSECAEDRSECPTCGTDTSGLNPAENGCPYCGGGTNDCASCGATGCASYRDDGRALCDDCYENDEEEYDDDEDDL